MRLPPSGLDGSPRPIGNSGAWLALSGVCGDRALVPSIAAPVLVPNSVARVLDAFLRDPGGSSNPWSPRRCDSPRICWAALVRIVAHRRANPDRTLRRAGPRAAAAHVGKSRRRTASGGWWTAQGSIPRQRVQRRSQRDRRRRGFEPVLLPQPVSAVRGSVSGTRIRPRRRHVRRRAVRWPTVSSGGRGRGRATTAARWTATGRRQAVGIAATGTSAASLGPVAKKQDRCCQARTGFGDLFARAADYTRRPPGGPIAVGDFTPPSFSRRRCHHVPLRATSRPRPRPRRPRGLCVTQAQAEQLGRQFPASEIVWESGAR